MGINNRVMDFELMATIQWDKFIGEEMKVVSKFGFGGLPEVKCSGPIISLRFSSDFIEAKVWISLNVVTGASTIELVVEGSFYMKYSHFVTNNAKLRALIKNYRTMTKNYRAALAKIEEQAAEIQELRLMPGGPEYLAAKARFESGYL